MKKIIEIGILILFVLNLSSGEVNQNVKNFSQLPDVFNIKISPDGKMIGVLREVNEERMVSVIVLETNKLIHNHKFIKKGEIGNFDWLNNERLLFTRLTKRAGENRLLQTGDLYAVNIDGTKAIMLTGRQAKRSSKTVKDDPKKPAQMVHILPDDEEHILAQFYGSSMFNDVYKVNINDGKLDKYVASPVRQPQYTFDAKGNVVAVVGINPDTYRIEVYIYNKNLPSEFFTGSACARSSVDCVEVTAKSEKKKIFNKDWTFWKTTEWDEILELVSFNNDSSTLTTIETADKDVSGVYETNLRTGKRKLLYRNKINNISYAHVDEEGVVYGARFLEGGYPASVFFKVKNKEKERTKVLYDKFPGSSVSVTALSDDETKATLSVSSDTNPGIYFLYNFSNNKVRALGKRWGSIDYQNLSSMDPISFPAKDGSMIYGYLTKSLKGESKNSPTIVHPHGGPDGVQDIWGFDSRVQMLASEGFNVLQVNYRGSGGYGLDYMRYIRGNWDGVLNDIFDGMRYLDKEGLIDINKACIYGASYGGYAATQSVMMEPDLFKCSVSDVGVYDLISLMTKKGDIQASRGGKPQLKIRLGTDKERHKEMSPSYNANKLTTPFFIIHGENDIRAPYEDAVLFSKQLNKLGIDHQTLWIKKEGHGYFDEEVRYNHNMAVLEFFNKHLN